MLASVLYARSCASSLLLAFIFAASSSGVGSGAASLDSRHDARLTTRWADLAAWPPELPALPALRALPATLPARLPEGDTWPAPPPPVLGRGSSAGSPPPHCVRSFTRLLRSQAAPARAKPFGRVGAGSSRPLLGLGGAPGRACDGAGSGEEA